MVTSTFFQRHTMSSDFWLILAIFGCLFMSGQSQLNYDVHSTSSTPAPIIGTVEPIKMTKSINLALTPIENDLLNMNIKHGGEDAYNIHELPNNDGQPVLVEVSLSLRNILEIDEHRQLVTLETTLRMYWRDPRLRVDHLLNNSSLDGDEYVLLHPETSRFIWFPDIYIDFAKALRMPTVIVRPASLRIYKNSTIRYATQINYDVACPMDFRKYPYDTQSCKVKYESYGHTIEKMRVVWKKGFDQSKVTDNNYISLTQFEYAVFFEENYEEEIASGVYPGVIMTLLLRRKISYHLLQTYLPSGLFVIVAWLSLFLPPESIPGRVTMAMTTLLTLAAMFGAVRQSVPVVSYVSALDIWMCTCIIFVFFALLEYVVVLCLINHCQNTTNKLDGAPPPVKNSSKHSGRSPNVCKKHASASVIDNNGTSSDMLGGSPCHALALAGETPSSPRASVKRRGLFFCCTGKKKTGNNRKRMSSSSQAAANMQQHQEQVATARIHIKHETQEHLMQGQYASAPSTLTRGHPNCTMCRTTSTSENISGAPGGGPGSGGGGNGSSSVRSRYVSQGTSTRIDSLQQTQAGGSSSGHSKRKSVPTVQQPQQQQQQQQQQTIRRPLQHVEKTCSFVMAALFLLFNALYWPWLLRDQDFDYAKFSATHQDSVFR